MAIFGGHRFGRLLPMGICLLQGIRRVLYTIYVRPFFSRLQNCTPTFGDNCKALLYSDQNIITFYTLCVCKRETITARSNIIKSDTVLPGKMLHAHTSSIAYIIPHWP